jgi:4-amino-4-deoxy-L-arabinose transferase-like glycosyltransferase
VTEPASATASQAARAEQRWLAPVLLFIVAVLFVAPLVGGLPLLDPDEGLHAAIAQEMVARGDYVTPRFLGTPFPDKPILFFWAQALAIRVFGSHVAAVRSVGLLFGLAGALATGVLARRLFGRSAGAIAFAVYATMLLPAVISQAAVHDIALVPWVVLALVAFVDARRSPTLVRAGGHAMLAGLWLGLALLTKGLVGVAITGIAAATWLVASRALGVRMVLVGAVALLVACGIAAPWYLAMDRANPGYLHYFFVQRHLHGFATDTQPHGDRPWWYYLPIVLAGALPWTAYLPWREPDPKTGPAADDGRRLAWGWLLGSLLFLSAASSKLVTYVLPVFPAIALLVARRWAGWIDADARPSPSIRRAMLVNGAAMAALVVGALAVAQFRFGVSLPSARWIAVVALATLWLRTTLAWDRRDAGAAFACVAALSATTLFVVARVIVPPVAGTLTARELASTINARGTFPTRLWLLEDRVGSVVFYLDPALRAGLTPDRVSMIGIDRLVTMRQAPADTLVAVPSDRVARLERRVSLQGVPYEAAGHYRVYAADTLLAAIIAPRSTR